MRFFHAMLLLAGSQLCTVRLSADVLMVGPIYINGTGSMYDPDRAFGEGFPGTEGFALSASGSNGTDFVSIAVSDVDLDVSGGPAPPMPSVGSRLAFSATTAECQLGASVGPPYPVQCFANIDGVMGIGSFTNLGGGLGTLQVYALENPSSLLGPLLAQAEVITYSDFITSVSTAPPNSPGNPTFLSTFVLQATPEPSAWGMGLIGIAALAVLRWRKLSNG